MTDDRRAEIAGNLRATRDRIALACQAAGRDPGQVTLVVITKTRPAQDIRILADLGVRDVGENRDQEAVQKVAQLGNLPLTWHFVGQLQRNKANSVARYADFVHSVDREALAEALGRGAQRAGRHLGVFVQVDLADDHVPGRGGCHPQDLDRVCAAVAGTPSLDLVGVMAVAPLNADPVPAFQRLAQLHAAVLADHPSARWVSAGMSHDLEPAIAAGATHVRVGTAVLGERENVR